MSTGQERSDCWESVCRSPPKFFLNCSKERCCRYQTNVPGTPSTSPSDTNKSGRILPQEGGRSSHHFFVFLSSSLVPQPYSSSTCRPRSASSFLPGKRLRHVARVPI